MDQHHRVGQALDLVQHVTREDHALAVVREPTEQLQGLAARDRIEPGTLVRDDDLGVMGDGLRESRALTHALGVVAHLAIHGVGEPHPLHRGARALVGLSTPRLARRMMSCTKARPVWCSYSASCCGQQNPRRR